MVGLKIRDAWLKFEITLGLIDDAALSVQRSEGAVQRSRARLATTDPRTLRRLFAARMDRERRSIRIAADAPSASLRGCPDGARLEEAAAPNRP